MKVSPLLSPPFNLEKAIAKVRAAENVWNTRNPERVVRSYSEDSIWRNRDRFIRGRAEIVQFLEEKWNREHDYRLIKELWAYSEHRIAVRFQYEWHDSDSQWFRSYGNELWEFDNQGLMLRREASINDVAIQTHHRRFLWPAPGNRPESHAGLSGVD